MGVRERIVKRYSQLFHTYIAGLSPVENLRDATNKIAFRGDNFRVALVEFGASPRLRLPLLEGDNRRTVKSVIGALR